VAEKLENLIKSVVELDFDNSLKLVREEVESGVPARTILKDGLIPGLGEVGKKFERHEYFLSELVFAAQIMDASMKILTPLLKKDVGKAPSVGKLVIGTVKGDLHDIGKNIFIALMRAGGFEVYDLGVDIPVEKFVEKVKEVKPDILGMSAILSIATEGFKRVIESLKKDGLRDEVYVMIGGPPLVTAEEVGADFYCNDAFIGFETAKRYVEGKRTGKR